MNQDPIWTSATKIAFLLLTIALIVGMFIGKIDPKDFVQLAGMAFAFYFVQKQNSNNDTRK